MEKIDLNTEELEEISPLLSRESYTNIKNEIKRLEEEPPSLKGSGVYNHQYVPVNEEELKQQNRIFRDRLEWLRTRHILKEIENQFLMRENRKLDKENRELREANQELRNELKRARNQLHSLMGIKKSGRKKDNDSEENDECEQKGVKSRKRGAPIGHIGRTRLIPEKVDKVETIPPPCNCPKCGNRDVVETRRFIRKYIEDIPPVARTVTEKRYMEGICSRCHTSVIEPEALEGPPVKIGPHLVTLLTLLRHQLAAPYRKLSQLCNEGLQIPLSAPGVLRIINRVSRKMEPIYKGIECMLRQQEVLHADETGWRMGAENWYLWIFCNKRIVYFHLQKSRGSKVPKSILGEDFDGVVHADFYAAYNFLQKTQRCLFHLQGDIKEELKVSPEDEALVQLDEGVKEIIQKGQEAKKIKDAHKREEAKGKLENTLQNLTQLDSQNQKTNAFIKRINKYQDSLLRFVDHPEIEYHNNRAERGLRHSVIFRKITFGNRTTQGAYYFTVMNSAIETARIKNTNIYQFIWLIWTAKPSKLKKYTRELLDTS